MAEREDNVYKAKLAEQAERYDGKKRGRGRRTKNRKKGLHQPRLTLGISRSSQAPRHSRSSQRSSAPFLKGAALSSLDPGIVVRAIFRPRRIGRRRSDQFDDDVRGHPPV